MASNNTPGYLNQVLEERYMKVVVLENYLDSKAEEFGHDRSIEVDRDKKIKIRLLRELTKDEILDLQKKSYPHNFEDPFAL